jgi:hypothetical protein
MSERSLSRFLLPNYFKKAGLVLFLIGVVVLYLRFGMGIKPDWLQVKVFAIYSSIFEVHYLSFTENNIGEEIGLLISGVGLFLFALSREKTEDETSCFIRAKAFILSVYFNGIVFVICVLFIFGWGFLAYMAVNLFLWLFSYNVIYLFLKHRYHES